MKKLNTKLISGLITVVLIGVFVFLGKDLLKDPVIKDDEKQGDVEVVKPPKEEEKVKIIDLTSDTRAIGVMIDNVDGAWPQAGLEEAFLVYDISVEYGLTRLPSLSNENPSSTFK